METIPQKPKLKLNTYRPLAPVSSYLGINSIRTIKKEEKKLSDVKKVVTTNKQPLKAVEEKKPPKALIKTKPKEKPKQANTIEAKENQSLKPAPEEQVSKENSKNKKIVLSKIKDPKVFIVTMIKYKYILQKKFPKAFPKNDYIPLTRDIRKPISKALNISHKDTVTFIMWYITRKGYLAKYKVGTWRIDLEGNNVDQITQEIYDLKIKGLDPRKLPLLDAAVNTDQ